MTSHLSFPRGLGRRALLACAVAVAVAGCSIPAKLNRPPVRDDVPLAGLDTGHRAGWPDAAWWKPYNDPQLDQLIEPRLQGLERALAEGRVRPGERVVLFNCASGLKYPMPEAGTPLKLGSAIDWQKLTQPR